MKTLHNKLFLFLCFCCFLSVCSFTDAAEKTYTINARVLAAGEAAKGKKATQLKPAEKEMANMLSYKNFAAVASGSKSVTLGTTYTLTFSGRNTVKVTPLSVEENRIKVKIVWHIKGAKPWKKTLQFTSGNTSMVGGPPAPQGGTFILSLTIS